METRFHVASVSSQYTAAAVLRLADSGAIDLNANIGKYLPEVGSSGNITVRDLLVEQSCIPDINGFPTYSAIIQQHQTPASLVAQVRGKPLVCTPGVKYTREEHSAYNVLALLLELLNGQPFAAAVQEVFFQPLSLTNSGADGDAIRAERKFRNRISNSRLERRFTSLRAFIGRQRRETAPRTLRPATKRDVWMHSSLERLTVVLLSNIYCSVTTTMGENLATIALGKPYDSFKPASEALTAAQLAASQGSFAFGPDFHQPNARISPVVMGNGLSVGWPSGTFTHLIPVGSDRFIDRSYWEPVTIGRDSAGSLATLTYGPYQGKAVK